MWQVEVVEGAATGTLARLTTAATAAKKPSLTKANSTSDRWAEPWQTRQKLSIVRLDCRTAEKLTNLLSTDC